MGYKFDLKVSKWKCLIKQDILFTFFSNRSSYYKYYIGATGFETNYLFFYPKTKIFVS